MLTPDDKNEIRKMFQEEVKITRSDANTKDMNDIAERISSDFKTWTKGVVESLEKQVNQLQTWKARMETSDFGKRVKTEVAATEATVKEVATDAKNWVVYSYQKVRDWFKRHMFWAVYVPVSLTLLALPFFVPTLILVPALVTCLSLVAFGKVHIAYKRSFDRGPGAAMYSGDREELVWKMGVSVVLGALGIAEIATTWPAMALAFGISVVALGTLAAMMSDEQLSMVPARA